MFHRRAVLATAAAMFAALPLMQVPARGAGKHHEHARKSCADHEHARKSCGHRHEQRCTERHHHACDSTDVVPTCAHDLPLRIETDSEDDDDTTFAACHHGDFVLRDHCGRPRARYTEASGQSIRMFPTDMSGEDNDSDDT